MTTTSWDDLLASLGLEPSTPQRPRFGPGARAECGTPAGCDRHYRLGEKPCEPCDAAKKAANRKIQQAKRRAAGIKPRPPITCGTPGGARRHRRLNEPACPACRDAFNQWQSEHRASRKAAA